MKGKYFVIAGGILISVYAFIMFMYGRKFAEKTRTAPVSELAIRLTWTDTPQEIREKCAQAIQELNAAADSVALTELSKATFNDSLMPYEILTSEIQNRINILTFYKEVSVDPDIRAASDTCEQDAAKVGLDLYSRQDLYSVFKAINSNSPPDTEVGKMLLKDTLEAFEQNGLALPESERADFTRRKKRLVELQSGFSKTLGEWKQTLNFSKKDLAGVPEDFITSLKRDGENYVVGLSYPHYAAVMENATSPDTRMALHRAFASRGGPENRDRLEEALEIRSTLAKDLGYPNHAALVLEDRMAKTPERVESFLSNLADKLKGMGESDRLELLALKLRDYPNAQTLEPWDLRFYQNKLKKEKYLLDKEKIKEYFPAKKVIQGMFNIYETLLSVRFIPWTQAPRWYESVEAYEIYDLASKKIVGHFYMDLYPRDGKYGHAAAFTLHSAFAKKDSSYEMPVSAIVANFTPARGDLPPLFSHADVETLFHEFGHIMHQTLTTVKIPSYSGTRVKRDYVEAPSQMLENWVWNSETLRLMSGHYKTGEPLPEELIEKMIAAKKVGNGIFYLQQIFYATLDLNYHLLKSGEKIDTTEVYKNLQEKITNIDFQKGTMPQASFGHLMGGYDAGYYGYLWSEVFAADMFTRFEKEGLLNPTVGMAYRKWILEKGGEENPDILIEGFLQRPSNSDAFLESIGI